MRKKVVKNLLENRCTNIICDKNMVQVAHRNWSKTSGHKIL